MADTSNKFRTVDIFWAKEDTEESDGGLIRARGMASTGNRRPAKTKKGLKGKKTVEVKATVPSSRKQPLVQSLPTTGTEKDNTVYEASMGSKKASLKDLCLEDKQRIANLIKELARLGEEKESALNAYEQERFQFENQVKELVTQQEQILKDREGIQGQLQECQDLLVKYQQLVNRQKQQLSDSLTEQPNKELSEETFDSQQHQNSNYKTTDNRVISKPSQQTRILEPPTYESLRESPREKSPAQKESASRQASIDAAPLNKPGNTDRPFTSMLDRLIADERNRSTRSTDDREMRLGPLRNPQFNSMSSTQDFQPLLPDPSTPQYSELYSTSSIAEDGVQSMNSGMVNESNGHMFRVGGALPEPKSVSTPINKGKSALIPEGLSDTEFMDYYHKLTPEDRKKQLFVQKQALLCEQERLKKVLAEQESLLEKKHNELRKQQEIQRERLTYFERTGQFPTHFSYAASDSYNYSNTGPMNSSAMAFANHLEYAMKQQQQQMQQQPFMPGMPGMQPQQHLPGYYPHQPLGPAPAQHMPGYPGPYMQQNGYAAPPPANIPMLGGGSFMPPQQTGYGMVGPGQSMQEQRHAEDDTASQSTRYTRSAGTSPRSDDNVPQNRGPRVERNQYDDAEPRPRQPIRTTQHSHNVRAKTAGNQGFDTLRDERAAHLLDLVDEVESLHNRSMEQQPSGEALSPYLQPSRRQASTAHSNHRNSIPFSERSEEADYRQANGRGLSQDYDVTPAGSCEDLEESQVLEDVFFIR